jgi:tetratricopeptide (TPR) repeat protein
MADRIHKMVICSILFFSTSGISVVAQPSIFSGFQNNYAAAEGYYQIKAYAKANDIYSGIYYRDTSEHRAVLGLALTFYHLHQKVKAAEWFMKYLHAEKELNGPEILFAADALAVAGDYDQATELYEQYLRFDKDNIFIHKKIWQIQNAGYLFEDSAYYHVVPLPINSDYDEYGPCLKGDTLVFVSNKPRIQAIKRVDASSNKAFGTRYAAKLVKDSINEFKFNNEVDIDPFGKSFQSKYQNGRVSFSTNTNIMVYASSFVLSGQNEITMGLFFTEKQNGEWAIKTPFSYNSNSYNIKHPFINKEGTELYYSSDMNGGFGGYDLYKSELVNGKWTSPENLGPHINTFADEGHPFLMRGNLYFSSMGHPGLGGIDIFQINLKNAKKEVFNPGYPMNTKYDDFGLVLDSVSKQGIFVSNRNEMAKKLNDDLYGIVINKIDFPIDISGVVRYKYDDGKDEKSSLYILSNAILELIDSQSGETIATTRTKENGTFSITIPMERQYKLKISHREIGVAIAAMEIPKNPIDFLNHEVVVVKKE